MPSSPSSGKPGRGVRFVQERSRDTLRRIIKAAEEVFSEKGYQKASVADIIARAGIGHGTFWLYFRNKDDLLRYLVQDMISEFESFAWYRENDPEKTPIDCVEDVEIIIGDVTRIFERHSPIFPLILRASLESEEFRGTLNELLQPFAHILEGKLREHLEKGLCSGLDPQVAALIILNMVEFANLQWLVRGISCDRETLVRNLSAVIFHALKHA